MEKRSAFSRSEDFWAIWIGIFFLGTGLIAFSFSLDGFSKKQQELESKLQVIEENEITLKTIKWYEHFDELKGIKASSSSIGKFFKKLTDKPGTWSTFPLLSIYLSEKNANQLNDSQVDLYNEAQLLHENALKLAKEKQKAAEIKDFKDAELNLEAEEAIAIWRSSSEELAAAKKKINQKGYNKIPWLIALSLIFGLLFGLGYRWMSGKSSTFLQGFLFVFLIALISFFLSSNVHAKSIGFGYAAWAIILGLVISNTIGTANWIKPALQTELYIKTGLVILGAEILIGKILAIGLPGIFVAWIVTPIVLISTYWFGQKVLKIGSKTLNITISADMSVCGVSAAVATAAASKATKEELTIAVGLSMIFTSIMMIVLPAVINGLGMPEVMGGAWIGGTIDATGAVVAAGAFLGETALSVAATIKMIQNILIGLVAFGVAIYFSRNEGTETKISWGEIWKRFPKFIIGFLGASVIFSLIYAALGDNMGYSYIDQGVIGGFTKNIRSWLFCLAFVSIGLSINFQDLKKHFTGGKPLILYVCGQAFNLGLTILMVYIMFYLVFPNITNSL